MPCSTKMTLLFYQKTFHAGKNANWKKNWKKTEKLLTLFMWVAVSTNRVVSNILLVINKLVLLFHPFEIQKYTYSVKDKKLLIIIFKYVVVVLFCILTFEISTYHYVLLRCIKCKYNMVSVSQKWKNNTDWLSDNRII